MEIRQTTPGTARHLRLWLRRSLTLGFLKLRLSEPPLTRPRVPTEAMVSGFATSSKNRHRHHTPRISTTPQCPPQPGRVSGRENPGHCKGAVGVRSCGDAVPPPPKSSVGAKHLAAAPECSRYHPQKSASVPHQSSRHHRSTRSQPLSTDSNNVFSNST